MTCFCFILSTTGLNCSLLLFYYWILWKHVPTHLGKGALHILRPPPRQINSGEPSRRYPILQEKDKVSPTPKL